MTFVSESVRLLYHQLPTTKQVEFSELEKRLARNGQYLQVEGVMTFDKHLEVVIRITDDLESKSIGSGAI